MNDKEALRLLRLAVLYFTGAHPAPTLAEDLSTVCGHLENVIADRESQRMLAERSASEVARLQETNSRITEERDALAARCTSLEETNEGLERDAARYRWLREHGHPDHESGISIEKTHWNDWGKFTPIWLSMIEADKAIDAAQATSGCAEERSEPKASGRSEATGDGSPRE